MSPQDASVESRRSAHLLVSVVIVAAFVIAAWDRLALPFSTTEARFVHEALRSSGQASTPDFSLPDNPVPAQLLAVIQQLVGTSERALRLAFLLLLAASAWILCELLPDPTLAGALLLTCAALVAFADGSGRVVSPLFVPVLATALALLAAPLGPPITNLRAVLGLAGMLALGVLGFRTALAVAAVLATIALVHGSALDRLTAFVTGACGVAAGWVFGGNASAGSPAADASAQVELLPTSGVEWWPVAALGIVVLGSLFLRDENRRQRLALLCGVLVGEVVSVAPLTWVQSAADAPATGVTGSILAVGAVRTALCLLLASAVSAFHPALRVGAAIVGAAAIVIPLVLDPPVDRTAHEALMEARAVAQPGSGLAVAGPRRVEVAVSARLGNAPSMPVIYVPEHATLATLADQARKLEVRQLWLYPPTPEVPPGFSAPASRPASPKHLMPLVLEGG